jgi:chitodextrinase
MRSRLLILSLFPVALLLGCPNVGDLAAPVAPSGLTATADSAEAVDLSWQDNSHNEDGFLVERLETGAMAFVEIADVSADSTSLRDTDVAVDTEYAYRVRAYNSAGVSDPSNQAEVTTSSAGPQTGIWGASEWDAAVFGE